MGHHNTPGRNDPCWCGSGLKFKRCHLGREDEVPVLTQELQRSLRQAFSQKKCLHPKAAAGVCTKVIDAHTVQRARTLQALLDSSNHVLTFFPFRPDSSGKPELQRTGWRKASTFTGFCSYHDSHTFMRVENEPFKFDPETGFLLTYRALCHELFQKIGSEHARVRNQPLIDRGKTPEMQREIQHRWSVSLAGVRKAVADLTEIKNEADIDLLAKNYSAWDFVCVSFSGPLCFATSGAPTPNQDIKGTPLQTLHDLSVELQHLYISVVADDGSPRVVLGWRRRHQAPAKLVASLLATSACMLPAVFVQYVFAHLENVYFSSAWWSSLSPQDQACIYGLAGNANAYYFPPTYAVTPTVPWSLVSIERINGVA